MTRLTQNGITGKMVKLAAIGLPFLSGIGLAQAATREEFNNLVTGIPALAIITIVCIWILSETFKQK